jgi:hypothetical protein
VGAPSFDDVVELPTVEPSELRGVVYVQAMGSTRPTDLDASPFASHSMKPAPAETPSAPSEPVPPRQFHGKADIKRAAAQAAQ